jgi:hypothetical protein
MWRTKNEKELKQTYTKKPNMKKVGMTILSSIWINFVVSFKVWNKYNNEDHIGNHECHCWWTIVQQEMINSPL